jgi:hypothetical protein
MQVSDADCILFWFAVIKVKILIFVDNFQYIVILFFAVLSMIDYKYDGIRTVSNHKTQAKKERDMWR